MRDLIDVLSGIGYEQELLGGVVCVGLVTDLLDLNSLYMLLIERLGLGSGEWVVWMLTIKLQLVSGLLDSETRQWLDVVDDF